MNEKQGEHLDQRIRQSLAGLPDGPPPGSSFDGAWLWEQLRPALTAQSVVAKKQPGGWWLAAASVAGLLAGLWWFQPFLSSSGTSSAGTDLALPQTRKQNRAGGSNDVIAKANPSLVKTPVLPLAVDKLVMARQTQEKPLSLQSGTATKSTEEALPSMADNAVTITAPETQPTAPEPTSLSLAMPTKKPAVAAAMKHRFRVVHENELPAEDEAYRVRYASEERTERFVRLGTGSRTMSAPDQHSPGLMLTLNRKQIQ